MSSCVVGYNVVMVCKSLWLNLALINVPVARPYVEYIGIVPQKDVQSKQKELELEANALISRGGKVSSDTCLKLLAWYDI